MSDLTDDRGSMAIDPTDHIGIAVGELHETPRSPSSCFGDGNESRLGSSKSLNAIKDVAFCNGDRHWNAGHIRFEGVVLGFVSKTTGKSPHPSDFAGGFRPGPP